MEIKSRPILFSSEMIRAILDGKKTMTRRVITPHNIRFYSGGLDYAGKWVKPDHELLEHMINDALDFQCIDGIWTWSAKAFDYQAPATRTEWMGKCQYGTAGYALWVRESFATSEGVSDGAIYQNPTRNIWYIADNNTYIKKAKPSIHMPRWASRITALIKEVRVERLQDISEEDAIAEGLKAITKDGGITIKYGIPDSDGLPGNDNYGWQWHEWEVDPRKAYKKLWESINGTGSWDLNPFVWVIKYNPHLINVDAFIAQHQEASEG